LAILYNLELATFTLAFPFVLIFVYGLFKQSGWVKGLLNKKTVSFSILLPVLVMLPVIIYDFSHGFKQTVVFLGWTLYKPFSFLFKYSSTNLITNLKVIADFGLINLQRLLFQDSVLFSLLLFAAGVCLLFFQVFKNRKLNDAKSILLLLLAISLLGIVVNQTPSDAYLPIAFPFVIFVSAILFEYLFKIRFLKLIVAIVLTLAILLNSCEIFRNDLTAELKDRISSANKIIKIADNQKYNLIGRGVGSQFRSFTMNYEYILWWKGHPVSNENVRTKIVVWETSKGIIIYKQ